MGLLDYLSAPDAGNGVGGLLSYLQSPLYRGPQAAPSPQPQYDAMGNYTGITPDAPNPFGPLPQSNAPSPFQPPSVFNGGAPASPIAGLQTGQQAPALPAPQTIAPAPQPVEPQRTADIGGYQMPQFGSAADYTPQPSQTAQAAPTDVSAQSRGQTSPAPAFLQPPSQGGFGGAFRGMAANAQAGPLGMLMGAIGGAAGMGRGNEQDIKQQNLTAQYHSLRQALEANGDSRQQAASKAMIAVMNPEAAKTIIPELFTNKEKFTEIGVGSDGTKQYGFVNDRDQTVTPYKTAGSDAPTSIQGPDGKLIQMPQGADPKTWRNEITRINADVAAGKKTEVQAKAEIFANKMELSNKSIADDIGSSLAGKIASGLPLGNYVQSPEYQKYKQASSNFITALLRQESGAAISKSEFDRYDKEYMPQPGDGKEVLAQKTQARQVAIEGMKKGAGPGYKSPTELGPSVGTVQMGYRFKGGNPADRNSWERAQ